MTRSLAGLALAALALSPLPALAGAPGDGGVVVLDNAHELRQGYCQGTISDRDGGTTTVAVASCRDGGIDGVAPGDTRAFPATDVLDARKGLAIADARRRFFAAPRVAAMLRGGTMPAAGEDLTPLATLAGQARLPDWQAFIGMLQPVADLGAALHHKRITAYTAGDFRRAMDAYSRYAAAERTAIAAYAKAVAALPAQGLRRGPGLAAGVLVQNTMGGYDLPFAPAMPDAWLALQQRAAETGAEVLAAYRRAMTPLGLAPFFVTELRSLERNASRIRKQAERSYAKAAEQTALAVLTDAEYKKTDPEILADVERALAPYSRDRAAALATAKARIARDRKLAAVADRIMATMHGRRWHLTIAETDGDPTRHYTMAFTRTGMHAIEARVYEQDVQTGKPVFMYAWPVYARQDGGVHINAAVAGLDNAFSIPAAGFASGRFRVKSEGFSEVFFASGTLAP